MDQVTVRNVTRAELYPVLPRKGKANGKAVLIAPGGGYRFVSMDSEGFRVADRLAQAGYAAFVLKYRTVPTPRDAESNLRELATLFGSLGKAELADHEAAVEDLALAVALLSERAAQWHIDPAQIHVIGFSAGARSAIRLLEKRPEAARARTVALMYPPMTQTVSGGPRPPLFLAIAADDPLFRQGGLNLVSAWLKQSANVEFHLYSGGSHGFGMRPQGTTSDRWIDHYLSWLQHQP
jgi:acetyl esterase/lipase